MKQKNTAIPWIFQHTKKMIPGIATLIAIGMFNSWLSVHFALISKALVDVATKQAQGDFTQLVLTISLMLVVLLLSQVAISTINIRVQGKIGIAYKRRLFGKLLRTDMEVLAPYHSGELLNRLTSDIGIIAKTITEILPALCSFLVRIVYAVYLLFLMDSFFTTVLVCGGLLMLVVVRLYGKRMKRLHKECQQTDGATRSFMQETLQNLLVIKSFRNEGAVERYSTQLQLKNYHLHIKRNKISILANICLYLAMTAGYYFALIRGSFLISKGLLTFGSLTAMLQLVGQVQSPFSGLSSLWTQFYSMLGSAERVMELEELDEEHDPERYDAPLIPYSQLELLQVKDLSFAYDRTPVFNHANWSMKKGQFVAITGLSGIGKSTLLKLMLGILKPNGGEVLAQAEDGHQLPLGIYTRDLFAYVPQRNMILSGTIRENITFFKENITDEEIIQAAQIACVWDFIESTPQGLETMLGENGLGLSEGQAQRIAIARAMLHGAPILLLDEATSALDEQTEERVLRQIKALKTKSCIIVSHKKAALDFCDITLIVEDGEIKAV